MKKSISVVLASTYRDLLNNIIDCVTQSLYSNAYSPSIRKVLIVRKGSMGDWICAKPALERMLAQYPNSEFHLLTTYDDAATATIYQMPFVKVFASIINMKEHTWISAFKQIHARKFDLVLELPADMDTVFSQLRNAIFYRLCGIEQGMGWQIARTQLFHQIQLKHIQFETEQIRLQQLLNKHQITESKIATPIFDQEDIIAASQWLNLDIPYVVFAIGAKQDKRRWPIENYVALSHYLKSMGIQVVFIGDEKDHSLLSTHQIAGINLCGKHTIAQGAAIISRALLCVCNDSGPMHMAYTLNTPLVTIFSARNYPGKWNPPSDSHHKLLVDYGVPCAGCINSPCSNNICMQNIKLEVVQLAVVEMLGR
jgi:heptosyltransferase-3